MSSKLPVVSVEGEVFFPGDYPISKNETFTSIINRAGGYTADASVQNTFFQRSSLINEEIQRFREAQQNLQKQLLLSGSTIGSNVDQDYSIFHK